MSVANQLLRERYGLELSVVDEINQTVKSILRHRTCRKYTSDPISDDLLTILLACSQSAPTKSNLQQYSIVVVRDPKTRTKVGSLVPSMEWLAKAPIVLFFLGDVRRIRRLAQIRGHDYRNNNTDTFMNATIDTALAMQALITGAESMGLGTCPISYVRNHITELSKLLALPKGVFPICGLTLGYRADQGYTSMRLPQEVIVHFDQYDDDNLELQIADFDERDHAHYPIPPKKQRHTEIYGVLEKCTWSENVSRQLSFPERAGFAAYLKIKGIKLV